MRRVLPAGADAAAERASGRVLATRFAGATTTLLLRLDAAPLALQVPAFRFHAPGDVVRLAVSGVTHVLEDRDADPGPGGAAVDASGERRHPDGSGRSGSGGDAAVRRR